MQSVVSWNSPTIEPLAEILPNCFSISGFADTPWWYASFCRKYDWSRWWAHRWGDFSNGKYKGISFKIATQNRHCESVNYISLISISENLNSIWNYDKTIQNMGQQRLNNYNSKSWLNRLHHVSIFFNLDYFTLQNPSFKDNLPQV